MTLLGAFEANMSEISHDGELSIEFNETIDIPKIFEKNKSLSLAIKRTDSELPEYNFYEGRDFNWTVNITEKKLDIKINFQKPFDLEPSDILNISFPSRKVFLSKEGKRLPPKTILIKQIPSQIGH